jgi:hypothetical protein
VGFDATLKHVRFSITDPDDQYCGLEFRARSMSIKEFTSFTKELTQFANFNGTSAPTEEMVERAVSLYKLFIPFLVDWNLEQEVPDSDPIVKEPVPPTLEGMQRVDPNLSAFIVQTWMEKVVGVNAPLGRVSKPGATSAVALIPMEISSPSQQNLSTQS